MASHSDGRPVIEFRRDRYYWVRFKYTPTLHIAKPHTIQGNSVQWWSMAFYDHISPIAGRLVEVLQEIPLPELPEGMVR